MVFCILPYSMYVFSNEFTQIFSVCVVLLWIVVSGLTVHGIYNQTLFVAPCLKDLREKRERNLEAGR